MYYLWNYQKRRFFTAWPYGYGKLPVCARGLQKYIKAAKPQEYLFGQPLANGAGGDFDNRYSQRGVKWAVKQVASGRHSVHTYITSHVCNSFARRWYGYYHAQRPFNTSKYRDDDGLFANCQTIDQQNLVRLIPFLYNAAAVWSSRCLRSYNKEGKLGLNTWQLRTIGYKTMQNRSTWGHINACEDCGKISQLQQLQEPTLSLASRQ
jgi:hypothetical protein